jgi:hypothetical protein
VSQGFVLDVEDVHQEIETVCLTYFEYISSDQFLNQTLAELWSYLQRVDPQR